MAAAGASRTRSICMKTVLFTSDGSERHRAGVTTALRVESVSSYSRLVNLAARHSRGARESRFPRCGRVFLPQGRKDIEIEHRLVADHFAPVLHVRRDM